MWAVAGTFFSVGLLEATGTWGGVELVDVWGSGWMGPSCLPGSVWPSTHPHPAPSLSLSVPLDNLPELEGQSSPVTPSPLPHSSGPSRPAGSCGAATPTTRTSARPRRGPRWMGLSARQAR